MATAACTPLITLVALVAWRGGAAEPLPVGDARPPAADQEFAWRVAAAPLFDAHVAVDLGGTAEEDAAALSRASGLAIAVAPEAVASHGRGRHHDDDIEVGLAIDRLAALAHGEVHMIGPRAVRIVALPLDPATAWAAREVTLSFEEVPLRDALARLAAASGVRIVVADDVGDPPPLTLAVTTMSTRNALDFITRLTGLHWQHQPDGSVVISRAQLPPNDEQRADAARAADAAARTRSIDQAVQAAWSAKATAVLARPMTPLPPGIALADAISQLQARSGLNIIVAPEVLAADAGRAVTVDARARTIGDVLSAVAEQAGCDIRRGQRTILLASKGASTQR